MPTYQFEAMDATGQEIRDVIDAATQEEAQATIRQMGYFVTKIAVAKGAGAAAVGKKKKKAMSFGKPRSKDLTAFTRQLSILQDAGLPILRSLRILEGNAKAGALRNSLMDVCDEIEAGATLSEAMGKSPKAFNRLYVNMIRAGEAGGALEVILRRLADFMERSESLKKKVKGAMIYPIVVILVAIGILTFIIMKIVPTFAEMFTEFELELPAPTLLLVELSSKMVRFWYLIPAVPMFIFIFIKVVRKFRAGRMGWDLYIMKVPVIGKLIEKNVLARTTRTLGTLVSSGVPILEALTITRETSGNAMFEKMFTKVSESIREGETISRPLKTHSRPGFHPVALFFWMAMCGGPWLGILFLAFKQVEGVTVWNMTLVWASLIATAACGILGGLWYIAKMNARVVDDLVVNMVDVGEETGELDTMLYKVADTYDEEVAVLTDGLMALIEPLLICFLGGAVGFIVISLFLPLISLIQGLS
jgi:type IV pilus assembly protein PilC